MITDYDARVAWKFCGYSTADDGEADYPGHFPAMVTMLIGRLWDAFVYVVLAMLALFHQSRPAFMTSAAKLPVLCPVMRPEALPVRALQSRERLTSRRTTGPPQLPAMTGGSP